MKIEHNTLIERLSIDKYADNLYSISDVIPDKRLSYYALQAKSIGADYIYCLDSELERHKIPFIYIYDYRNRDIDCDELARINKRIWTIGEITLAIVVYSDEIKIIDTRQPVKINKEGKLEASILYAINSINSKLKEKIFEGRIIENREIDYVAISPYAKLLEHIDKKILSQKDKLGCSSDLLRKLVVKCILIKYLEEQVDEQGENIFKNNFLASFLKNKSKPNVAFCDILREGDIPKLFFELSKKFNGGIFDLNDNEVEEISGSNLSAIATALDGRFEIDGQASFWQLYDLKFIPIEFISRLYERFILSVDGRQKKDGAYYTPPHLARLLVDELLPFDKEIDFDDFKLLDPSCGSGIFLVLAYKRLITLWMLQNGKERIEGKEDVIVLKRILSNCIYGVDINRDAVSITATSLQIEYTSHFNPKDIELIQFDNLIERGNLSIAGFFKWYKNSKFQFNIIVGNPPFNINKEENRNNKHIGIDDNCDNEFYIDGNNKKQSFPYKNPALTFLYKSLEKLLKPSGLLFMIMPSSAFLYNPTSLSYKKAVFSSWNTLKIYDFTPLKDFLWGKTKVATIAVLIQNIKSNHTPIEHIVVRSSYLNNKGSLRFQVDKYDRFTVPFDKAIHEKYYWKTNLLGGGRLHFYVNKYLNSDRLVPIKSFISKWSTSNGFRTDKSSSNQVDLEGMELLCTDSFISDTIEGATYIQEKSLIKRRVNDNILTPPNILIRLNANYSIPIILNRKKEIGFFPGVFGIKGNDELEMEKLVQTFTDNRFIYKTLMKLLSSKIYMQQSGEYTIDAQDIKNLPIEIDE